MTKISKRLTAAGEAVRHGARIADVGTDHALLPIFLYETGRIVGGVASDINRGPLERARANLSAAGLSDKMDTVLCDGLSALESYAPTDILILGMGGDLIASILEAAPWIRRDGIRLILQPMTHPETVRFWLAANGFSLARESVVLEDKLYQIIAADYTGEVTELTEAEALLGPLNLKRGGELTAALCRRYEEVFVRRMEGKASAGLDTAEEERMLGDIRSYLEP
ncbi:MAG: SAM-dependent methyltransferase [Clostridia bacterium]|nr:SAM-dependent methyltransferase [Clostridia bacterium]